MIQTIAIIGAGVIGVSVAYELSKNGEREIFVLEKNNKIRAENQSSRNSGVIHAGIYYPQDKAPLKAKLCIEGNSLLYDFCREFDVPHKNTGKLVVATDKREEEYLDDVLSTALANGVPDVKKLTAEEVREFEPNVRAISGLYIPTSGIVDATGLVSKIHSLAVSNGVYFATGTEVTGVVADGEGFIVTLKSGGNTEKFGTKMLINSAGLYSADIARMVNPESAYEAAPLKGESARFYKTRSKEIAMKGMSVYPVPYGVWPDGKKAIRTFQEFRRLFYRGEIHKTVGVHLTPTLEQEGQDWIIGDTVTIGPYYTPVESREDYSHMRGKKEFLDSVKSFFPGICEEHIELHQTGINAKIRGHYDFIIQPDKKHPNCINLLNIDSPGLTSSLSIAKYVSEIVSGIK